MNIQKLLLIVLIAVCSFGSANAQERRVVVKRRVTHHRIIHHKVYHRPVKHYDHH